MLRLTGLDSAFLALESPTTHLHVMGVLVLDPADVPGGLTFRKIRRLVADRVPAVPPFRQRLVDVALGLQHPVLVDDPDFDLDVHVRRHSLPTPGGRGELDALKVAARVDVQGAQSYSVLQIPGVSPGVTTAVVWIQDSPGESSSSSGSH